MDTTFKTQIVEVLEPVTGKLARARELYVLRIDVRGTASAPVIEVLLDGPRDITLQDCEGVSKELGEAIESHKLVKGNYRLDVMSPGLEEPLVKDWQFQRNIGRLVEVHYQDDGEHHTLHGHLRAFDSKEIGIEPVHIKSAKIIKPKSVATDAGPLELESDEQLYDPPVELVKITRKHLTKVVVQPDFRK